MPNNAEVPIWGDELQEYLNIGDEADNWQNVTNLLSWEFDDDEEAYEPDYIDTKKKKKFTVAKSASIEYEKDAYLNNDLDEFLIEHENEANIAVDILRVRMWQPATEGSGYVAQKAQFALSTKPLDNNAAREAVKLKGSLSMLDNEWTKGTFDPSTKAFTADSDTDLEG